MKCVRHLSFALLASASLAACSQPAPAPMAAPTTAPATPASASAASAPAGQPASATASAPPPAAAQSNSDPSLGVIGQQVDQAFAQASRNMRSSNITLNNGFDIRVGGKPINGHGGSLPKAEITPAGDLLIEGKPVAISPAQRQQLLAYRERVFAVADAGMNVGARGVDIAGSAVLGIPGLIFGGDDARKAYEARMKAEGEKIEAAARGLCELLPPMRASQQQLAASLPAFRPYATMTQVDVDECIKDSKVGSVDSNTGLGYAGDDDD